MTLKLERKEDVQFRVMKNANWRKPVYETNGLNLWYGTSHALKNIDLSINEKEVTAIIGPSGCGKSTYLKTLNRMVEMVPDVTISGNVTFKGKNILERQCLLKCFVQKSAWCSKNQIHFQNRFMKTSHSVRKSMASKTKQCSTDCRRKFEESCTVG